jgi:hypothetical protein
LPEEAIANGALKLSKKAQQEKEDAKQSSIESSKVVTATEEIVDSKVDSLVQG